MKTLMSSMKQLLSLTLELELARTLSVEATLSVEVTLSVGLTLSVHMSAGLSVSRMDTLSHELFICQLVDITGVLSDLQYGIQKLDGVQGPKLKIYVKI